MCNKFGNPENDDAYEVFGQKFFQNYNSSQWQKYIAPLVLDDGKQQRAGPSQLRMDKPMTSIFLNYAKLRLWVEENLGACYDEDKINEMKAAGHKAAGARRIANWDMVAEKVYFPKIFLNIFSNILDPNFPKFQFRLNRFLDSPNFYFKIPVMIQTDFWKTHP